MKTREIKHDSYRVVVREASRRGGIRRLVCMNEANEWLEAQGYARDGIDHMPPAKLREFMVVWMERPACLGSVDTYEIDGNPADLPDCDAFLDLPDALVAPWSQAVTELNPHWIPKSEEESEEEEKKDENPPTD